MSGWKVDPAGVQSVLHAVQASSEPLAKAVGALEGSASGAVSAAQSQLIADAVTAFFGVVGPEVQTMTARIPAALHGTVNAANAILEGDTTMAARIEQEAAGGFASAGPAVTAMPHGGGRVPR